jgi:translation initiation factor 1
MLKKLFAGTKWDVPCEKCAKPLSQCECPPPPLAPPPGAGPVAPSEQGAVVRVEKRNKGKKVTVVAGLVAKDQESLLPKLKALCGAGGTLKDGCLEVQGEHRDKIEAELARLGYGKGGKGTHFGPAR